MSASKRVQKVVDNNDNDDDNDNEEYENEDDTTFISTCHSVRFDTPVSHICNCVYNITPSSSQRQQRQSQQNQSQQNQSQQSQSQQNQSQQNQSQLNQSPTIIKKKPINCLAVAGRDGFIRVFESDAPFSSLFAFPIRYERVLSLEFLPKTSSFISVEHTADGSGNHVVIYEDWQKFPS